MKLFVDSADPTEIGACVAAEGDLRRHHQRVCAGGGGAPGRPAGPASCSGAICGVANGPVSVVVTAADRDQMLRDARDWAAVAANVYAVLPASDDGIAVVRACAAERIRTGVAAGDSAELALVAARAGAALVTAPVGRVGGVDGYDMIRKLVALFRTYEVATQVDRRRDPHSDGHHRRGGVRRARRVGAGRRAAPARRREHAARRRAGDSVRCESASTSTR